MIQAKKFNMPPEYQRDAPLYKGALNTPVMSNLDISPGSYTDNSGRRIEFSGITIDTVLFTMQLNKNIITVNVQGSDNGSIKEYIGMNDYSIGISLIIASGQNGVYPYDEVNQLKAIIDAPVALKINSRYLNNLGIYNIVITGATFPQEMGGYSQQTVNIDALSDAPTEIIIQQ